MSACKFICSFIFVFTSIGVFFSIEDVKAQSLLLNDSEQLLTRLITEHEYNQSVWSISVRDSSGTEIISVNSDKLMRIASNSKLFISGAVLSGLGPDFTFTTSVYGDGELRDSLWVGDIFIIGSGDPSIDGNFYEDNPFFVFDSIIDQLLEMGIEAIDGNIYGNEALFDDVRYPRGWEWDDLSFYYAPEIGALSFNRNTVELTVRADRRPGSLPSISWFPFDTDYIEFINEQVIGSANIRFNESIIRVPGTNTVFLRSTLPTGFSVKEPITITEPALYFIDTFVKRAAGKGIIFEGELLADRQIRNTSTLTLLAQHESFPVSKIVQRLNRESDNFYTEMLTKSLAAYKLNTVATTETGLELVSDYLEELNMDTDSISFRDASGMASANLTSAGFITEFLYVVNKQPYSNYFNQSLAVAGFNGTLRNRMINSEAVGRIRGKTGFISGVRSLSGYIQTKNNNVYSFSMITNNFIGSARPIDRLHEQILEYIYAEF